MKNWIERASGPWRVFLLVGVGLVLITGCQSLPLDDNAGQESEKRSTTLNEVTLPPMDVNAPLVTETATFAMGCFWGVESRFGALPGVIRTQVGYTGGTKENPTYHNLGDHTETLTLEYDPQEISYEALLDVFWAGHNPTARAYSQQYKAAVFYHTPEQKALAEESRRQQAEAYGEEVHTEILPAERFYPAEEYHQKYRLQQTPRLMQAFEEVYPEFDAFVDSTAAARVNGYLGGHGSLEQFEKEREALGLSEDDLSWLRQRISR